MDYQLPIATEIQKHLNDELTVDEVLHLLEKPKLENHGDLAFPTFQLAKVYRKNPGEIANHLADKIESPWISSVQAVGPYVNFKLNRERLTQEVLNEIIHKQETYGDQNIGKGENVPVDMSSPNIAKPMSMGHLRSTVIGNSLAKILYKVGFNPIRINHLGDWGTQFGKLITAYKKWGSQDAVKKEPIKELLNLYVKFHEEADNNPELEDEGRHWFKKLEDGDQEAYELWEWFRQESLKEFEQVYQRLNIEFDSYKGEAFYNDKMADVVNLLEENNLLEFNQGAYVVNLDEYNLNPALIKKSDGATLYITRDLAAALYRKKTYCFDQTLYVVGKEQTNHFSQLKAILEKLGYEWADNIHHIAFGLITKDGKKLSTRKGKVVLLEEVLNEARNRAFDLIKDKNPTLHHPEEVAEQVGVGAVVFHDLKNDRLNDFDFTIDEVVQFEGETGPYVQYTRARALSILDKAGYDAQAPNEIHAIEDNYSFQLVKLLQEFPEVVKRAYENYEPSIIAKHSLNLAQAFNRFYANVRVLDDSPDKQWRLSLVDAVSIVLKLDLNLLGVQSPDQM